MLDLDFLPPAPPKARTLGTTVEAVIFCDDPVASSLHRAVAAGLDWSMVLLAYGLFLLVFRLAGGEFVFDKASLLMIGAVLPVLGCLYGLTWAIAGKETPGMRWANLRFTTFDGFPAGAESASFAIRRLVPKLVHCGRASLVVRRRREPDVAGPHLRNFCHAEESGLSDLPPAVTVRAAETPARQRACRS